MRESGFYWVKTFESDAYYTEGIEISKTVCNVWNIAYFNTFGDSCIPFWDMFGCDDVLHDNHFMEIGDKVETPDKYKES